MANYIKSEVLAEAYTHLDIDIADDQAKLNALKQELTAFFSERATFLFGTDVEIKVLFEEGSLKTRVIAVGSAAVAILSFLSDYGGFKQGISALANDAVALAQAANMEVVFRTKTPPCDRLRVEKRKGVFGRVAALLGELDTVSAAVAASQLPTSPAKLKAVNEVIDDLIAWDERVDVLFEKFEDNATVACVADGLLEEVKNMLSELPWAAAVDGRGFRSQLSRSDPHLAAGIASAVAKYSAARKAIYKKLKDRSESTAQ